MRNADRDFFMDFWFYEEQIEPIYFRPDEAGAMVYMILAALCEPSVYLDELFVISEQRELFRRFYPVFDDRGGYDVLSPEERQMQFWDVLTRQVTLEQLPIFGQMMVAFDAMVRTSYFVGLSGAEVSQFVDAILEQFRHEVDAFRLELIRTLTLVTAETVQNN